MQLDNGTYPAHPTGRVEVGEHANGCLIATMEYDLGEGRTISGTFWLTTKDGAINTRAIETIKEIFGWDGTDPFWLVDHAGELIETEVDLVIENEEYKGKWSPKVKWVNAPGRGNQVANSDRKALLSKYGAKLRAISGGIPAGKRPEVSKSKPPEKSEPPKEPAPDTDGMKKAWAKLTEAMANKPRKEVEAQWFEILKDVCGEKATDAITPEEWAKIINKIEVIFDNIPI